MTLETILYELRSAEEFFLRSSECLTDEYSHYRPTPQQMTATEQIAHAAQTAEWFADGMVNPAGFDLDFAAHAQQYAKVSTISEAKQWFQQAVAALIAKVEELGAAGLDEKISSANIMAGRPRWEALIGFIDHTAHHRGALTVYSRLLGLSPKMPYMD